MRTFPWQSGAAPCRAAGGLRLSRRAGGNRAGQGGQSMKNSTRVVAALGAAVVICAGGVRGQTVTGNLAVFQGSADYWYSEPAIIASPWTSNQVVVLSNKKRMSGPNAPLADLAAYYVTICGFCTDNTSPVPFPRPDPEVQTLPVGDVQDPGVAAS